ncbi:hypothetical protein PGB90_000015 [Kerria lacca]
MCGCFKTMARQLRFSDPKPVEPPLQNSTYVKPTVNFGGSSYYYRGNIIRIRC